MRISASPYFLGSGLGILSLFIYFLVEPKMLSLWISFFISLILPIVIFGYLIKKAKIKKADFVKVSLSGGITVIIIAWISIKVYPPFVIRDIWDIVTPYINALYIGVTFSLIFSFIGFVFVKMFNKKNEDVNL